MSDEEQKSMIEIYDTKNQNKPIEKPDCLYEWRDYAVKCEGASKISTGTEPLTPLRTPGFFLLRFKNQLGIANLCAYRNGQLLDSRSIEVITDKLGDAVAYHDFIEGLIYDLYQQVVSLPFSLIAPIGYGVEETLLPPTPLFVYHFLRQYHDKLEVALNTIRAAPYRRLRDYADFVPVTAASEVDAEMLITMFQSPKYLEQVCEGHPLALLHTPKPQEEYYGPNYIWQRLSEETYDTPENRFVRHFIGELIVAVDELTVQPLWVYILKLGQRNEQVKERQQTVIDASGLIHQATSHAMFDGVGEMRHFPIASQVLMRRAGYHEMRELWQSFSALAPFFATLDQAIELREADKLYEFWVFFKLAEILGQHLKAEPTIRVVAPEGHGLLYQTKALFCRGGQNIGELRYNSETELHYWLHSQRAEEEPRKFPIKLRPDYTFRWHNQTKPDIGFDAKFRVDDNKPEKDDLVKMHAYCHMLKLQAALILYPGDNVCYTLKNQPGTSYNDLIAAVLDGSYTNVGAVGLRPDQN